MRSKSEWDSAIAPHIHSVSDVKLYYYVTERFIINSLIEQCSKAKRGWPRWTRWSQNAHSHHTWVRPPTTHLSYPFFLAPQFFLACLVCAFPVMSAPEITPSLSPPQAGLARGPSPRFDRYQRGSTTSPSCARCSDYPKAHATRCISISSAYTRSVLAFLRRQIPSQAHVGTSNGRYKVKLQ